MTQAMQALAAGAKQAARVLAKLTRGDKDAFLLALAAALEARQAEVLAANAEDMAAGAAAGLSAAMLDRLRLDGGRLTALAGAVRDVAALFDLVGDIVGMQRRPNGMQVGRMRVPLGVIAIIYESRPNVTVDAAVLCFKAGNACILRGGKEAVRSNTALGRIMRDTLAASGLPAAAIGVVETTDRDAMRELLQFDELIDVVIPRGGENLIRFVREHARIPVISHLKGVCHTYVDAAADLAMAEEICFNAKVQRPGVCNAMETMLVHRAVAAQFLPAMCRRLAAAQVELRGCPETVRLAGVPVTPATEADWPAEYTDLILAVRVVDSLDAALDHIARYSSQHSDAIVTNDWPAAQRFLNEVDSAAVFVNASTRFNDGGEFGLGAEIGISTQKLHCRGPMGLAELTSLKFVVLGSGQVRG